MSTVTDSDILLELIRTLPQETESEETSSAECAQRSQSGHVSTRGTSTLKAIVIAFSKRIR